VETHQPIPKESEQRTCRAIGNLEIQQTEFSVAKLSPIGQLVRDFKHHDASDGTRNYHIKNGLLFWSFTGTVTISQD
jgi:hypothetical protein